MFSPGQANRPLVGAMSVSSHDVEVCGRHAHIAKCLQNSGPAPGSELLIIPSKIEKKSPEHVQHHEGYID